MSRFTPSFPVPDWLQTLNSTNYPTVFLLDKEWADSSIFRIEKSSKTTAALSSFNDLVGSAETKYHGEKTRFVLQAVAHGIPDRNITLVSLNRKNILDADAGVQRETNLAEALFSVQALLTPGDLVVISVGPDSAMDSYARDPLAALLLNNITDLLGGIVVIAAGNKKMPLGSTFVNNAIITGGVTIDGNPHSRYGSNVTCYAVVPYNIPIPGLTASVSFDRSSAATAYTAGLILIMLNYARSRNKTLRSEDIIRLLTSNGTNEPSLPNSAKVPNWEKLRLALDAL